MYIILDVCRRVVYLPIIATLISYAFAILLSQHLNKHLLMHGVTIKEYVT